MWAHLGIDPEVAYWITYCWVYAVYWLGALPKLAVPLYAIVRAPEAHPQDLVRP